MTDGPHVLNSWKEIARYLDRGIRTVQRWEADLGLPVRRPRGKDRTAVIAIRADIDEWLKACPISVRGRVSQESRPTLKIESRQLPARRKERKDTSDHVVKSRQLRVELRRLQNEVWEVAGRLLDLCQKLRPETSGGCSEQRGLLAWTQSTIAEVRPPKVLVVDDNEIQSYVMTKTLELAGFVVDNVYSGDKALAMMEIAKPDAVVLDVNMPGMSGLDVCSRIKQDPKNCDLPIIIYTSDGPAMKYEAESLGATAFLTYPMNSDQLTQALSTVSIRTQ